jgi:hypothetical protein
MAVFAILMFARPDRILIAPVHGLGMASLPVAPASSAAPVTGAAGDCPGLGEFQLDGTSARRARGLE